MSRLLVHVEGETEETFVNEVLAPHLHSFGYVNISARLMGNARQRDRRGGIRAWSAVRGDIVNHLKQDTGCLATMMVDYYGLPSSGARAWPGRMEAPSAPFSQRAALIECALRDDVRGQLGAGFDSGRFIPYIVMHEFEGLLFSDCSGFGRGIGRPELTPKFQQIRDCFQSPEEINDSPLTAPSKRVAALVPEYQKPLLGTLAVLEIGIGTIRAACPHFHEWLQKLENWPK